MLDYIVTPIASSILFRIRGGGLLDAPRWAWVAATAALCYFAADNWLFAACWLWVYLVIGISPTHALFTAIHGNMPIRRDHWLFQWQQEWASFAKGRLYGVVYGVMRSLPALPAFIIMAAYSGSLLPLAGFVIALHGVVYYFARSVPIAEYVIGYALGLGLVCL